MARVQLPIEVRTEEGEAVENAIVSVRWRSDDTQAPHWANETGGSSVTTTFLTDVNGRASRWVDPGTYTIIVSKGTGTMSRGFDAQRGDGVSAVAAVTVGSQQFADQAITNAKFTDASIFNAEIINASIDEERMADDAFSARTIVSNAATNVKVADDAVTTAKILDRAVGADEIASGEIGGGELGTNELANGAVTSAKFAAGAVTSTKIQNDAFSTAAKIADGVVGAVHVQDNAVLPEHISNDVLPIGIVLPWAYPTAPSAEWMIPSGQSLVRADYPALFTAIGVTYGSVDGTHFTLPDYQGTTLVGLGTHANVNAFTDNDGVADKRYRSPHHGHTLGTADVATGGGHEHLYTLGRFAGIFVGWSAYCCAMASDGHDLAGTSGGGGHTHVISGTAGNLFTRNAGYGSNYIPYQSMTYIMKVL